MDDSLLFDIYEDLSVDKWTKNDLVDKDSNIDLFAEALAVHTIDKAVEYQLAELRKENEKLRQENAELRESKKQLSKNISSLFLTARREILEKERKIADLMLERQQRNREPCRIITDESFEPLSKSQKLDSKQQENCEPCRITSELVEPLSKAQKLDLKQQGNWHASKMITEESIEPLNKIQKLNLKQQETHEPCRKISELVEPLSKSQKSDLKQQENCEPCRKITDESVESLSKTQKYDLKQQGNCHPSRIITDESIEPLSKIQKHDSKQQENHEPCRKITHELVESFSKTQKHDSKQVDKHLSFVTSKPAVCPREKTPQNEFRDKLKISQLDFLSRNENVASRKRHRSDKYASQSVHNRSDKYLDQPVHKRSEKYASHSVHSRSEKYASHSVHNRSEKYASHSVHNRSEKNASHAVHNRSDKYISRSVHNRSDKYTNQLVHNRSDKNVSESMHNRCDKYVTQSVHNRSDKYVSQSVHNRSDKHVSQSLHTRSDKHVSQSVQNTSDNFANSKTHITLHDKLKSNCISLSTEVNLLHDNYSRSSNKGLLSDDRRSHDSNTDKSVSRKDWKSFTQKNNLKLSETESQNYVKIRNMETPQNSINSQLEESDDDSYKHTGMASCSELENVTCKSKSKTLSILPESSSQRNSGFNVQPDTASRPMELKCILQSKNEIDKTFGSHNSNFSEKPTFAASNATETSGNHYSLSLQDTKMNNHVQSFDLTDTNESESKVKSGTSCGNIETVTTDKNVVKVPACSNGNKMENDMSNIEQDSCPPSYECSADTAKNDSQTLFNGKDNEHVIHKSPRKLKLYSRERAGTLNDSDINNSGSFSHEKFCPKDQNVLESDHHETSPDDKNVNSMQHITYITCTSNLILLGDEETTCTTMSSPNKFQPSEFYPPGVRGDVREGGSHVRHIRGLTEIITKMPNDVIYSLNRNEQDNAVNETVQLKKKKIGKVTKTSGMASLPDNISGCQKSPFKSQRQHQVEGHDISYAEEPSKVKPGSSENLPYCGTNKEQDWVSTVNRMFGDVFKKNLNAWKHESENPCKSQVGDIKSTINTHNFMGKSTICQKSI